MLWAPHARNSANLAMLGLACWAFCPAQSLPGDRVIPSDAPVQTVAFSKDGSELSGSCEDGKIRVWDAVSGAAKSASPAPPPVRYRSAASRDGSLLARAEPLSPGSSEVQVRVTQTSGSPQFSVRAGYGGLSALLFSPDGKTFVGAGYDADIRAWSATQGELLRHITELPVTMFALAFSPDGRSLAAAGADRTVYIFDAHTWQLSRKLTGQPEMISSLAFSPDGRVLATGGFNDAAEMHPVRILFWDFASGKVLRDVPAAHVTRSVAFSPDGKFLVSASREKAVRLWAVPSPAR